MAGPEHSSFAELLKRCRVAAGLTQEELAQRAAVSARAVSALERGVNSRPQRETLRLLGDALGLTGETRAAFESAARRSQETAAYREGYPHVAPLTPLIGRGRELGLLENHLAGEGPPVLLFAGEPGIGKTRLLQEAAQRGRLLGMTVVAGGCQQQSGRQPHSPLLEAVERYIRRQRPADLPVVLNGCAWLVRMLPELETVVSPPTPAANIAPEQERRLMFRAVLTFLENVAGAKGTLLLLDDLQWAAHDALDLLRTVAASADALPIRVAAAHRHTEITPETPLASALSDMAEHHLAERVLLGPLSHEEAAQLLNELLDGEEEVEPAMRGQLVRRAEGVPFFLVSLAQAFRAGALTDVSGALPWSIAESVRQHVATLPSVEQEVLSVAAVAGRVVTRSVITSVVPLPEARVAGALETLCRVGLLRENGTQAYRFAHDIIREVVEVELGAARRAVLHRQIGETLEQVPEQERERRAAELAFHFREAGDLSRTFQYSVTAGDRAEVVFAHREAEQRFRTALELARELGDESREAAVLEKLGAALGLQEEHDEARAVLERAAEIYRASGNLERLGHVTAAIARVHLTAGWVSAEALARLRRLIEALQSTGSSRAVPGLYAQLAALLFLSGRYEDQLEASQLGIQAAAQLGDQQLGIEAEYFHAFALFLLGRLEESLDAYSSRLTRIEASGDLFSLGSAVAAMAAVYLHMGELEESRSYAMRAVELAQRVSNPWQICNAVGILALTDFITGAWPEARRGFDRALALGEHSRLPYALWQVGWLELARGNWDKARQILEESTVAARRTGNLQVLRWAESLLAELDLLLGNQACARERLLPLLDRPGLEELDVTFLLPRLAWADMELGDMQQAAARAGEAVERARRQHHHLALPDALRVQGVVLGQTGCTDQAETAFDSALALSRSMPYPYATARVLYEWGRLERQRNDSEQARLHLEEALAMFRQLGARPFIERTEQALQWL